jgi:hypothetical protein
MEKGSCDGTFFPPQEPFYRFSLVFFAGNQNPAL